MKLRFLLAVVAAPTLALAQPPVPTGAEGNPTTAPTPAPVDADEARIREIVDREIARVLTERAAKEAADKAVREAAEKETATTVPADKDPDLTGASGFMDTRLAFTLTHENILAKPGETIPSAPGWRFGVPNSLGVLFFDNYDTRFSGFETLNHAVAYRSYSRGHLQAEGAFVLRIQELTETNIALADAGTYITISNWKDPTHKDPTRISLTAFPVSSDRFRLGYSYRLSWGGSPEYRRSRSSTPGVKLQYDTNGFYGFIGAKSSTLVDPNDGELKGAVAVLAGAGIDPMPNVRLEVNGGYFDRGYNELQDVQQEKVQLFGVSAQASINNGMSPRSSVDYRLYKYNGERVSPLFNPEKYPGGLSWLAQAEFTMLGQTLKDPGAIGDTVIQKGYAGDVNVRVKKDRIRLRADLSFRDLAFILHSQPSLPPYSDFPEEYKVKPNLFAAIGFDKNWGDWLTLGAIVGVEQPATLTSEKGIPGDTTMTSKSTAVIRNNNIDTLITILPEGKSAAPQFAVKGSGKIDFGRIYTVVLEVFYSYDPNQSRFEREGDDPDSSNFKYVFGEFNQLGLNATLQCRF
ncbi:MAG: hypothetical protein H0T89_08140 [Deltaproteobacteria bacterium]|nr:hypothetical protein [Deltaproteobacteria bacterium]